MKNLRVCVTGILCMSLLWAVPGSAKDQKIAKHVDPEVYSTVPPGPPPPPLPAKNLLEEVAAPVSQNLGKSIFTKNTGSPIFMLMKDWKCENMDGKQFLVHVIQAYGKAAEVNFHCKGLTSLRPFQVTLEESEITLDELLDRLEKEHQFTWGADVPEKTIYFAPVSR